MNNKNKFKKGDRVRISKDSEYYDRSQQSNPSNCIGTVTKCDADGYFTTEVKWDNGEYNSYRDYDLDLVSEASTAELTVDKEFVMQAYKSACSDWKKKIEQKFPELFPSNPYTKLVEDESKLASSSLYYQNSDGEFVALLNSTALIDGVAGCNGIPKEAKYRGIYIHKHVDVEVVKTGFGTSIIFKDKK